MSMQKDNLTSNPYYVGGLDGVPGELIVEIILLIIVGLVTHMT